MRNNIIKICDFGWSSFKGNERKTFCGTYEYISPEVYKGLPQTEKVDIWALGIMLYELIY